MLDKEVWCLSVGTPGFSLWRIFMLCMDDSMHRSIGSLSLCHGHLYQEKDGPYHSLLINHFHIHLFYCLALLLTIQSTAPKI